MMHSSRRNGKPASCEPCRKTKTRCDHAHPTCGRCHQRGIAEKCFYHPAPLTKPRGEHQNKYLRNSRITKRGKSTKNARNMYDLISENQEDRIPSSPQDHDLPDDGLVRNSYQEGYLGPTSYAALFPMHDDASPRHHRHLSASPEDDYELSVHYPLTKEIRHQMVVKILKSFRNYHEIQGLVKAYWRACESGVVPDIISLHALDALKTTVDKYNLTEFVPSPELVAIVLDNSSKPLEVSPTLPAHEFYKLCTGDNLRLEMIGHQLATAGKAWYLGLEPMIPGNDMDGAIKPHFIDEMFRSSTMCLILSTLITPINDVMLWHLFDNFLLSSAMNGMSSPIAWQRLGELATQIYSLGIHRESNNSNIPPFLAETRRRVYCAIYNLDKSTSTFLGRPALLCKRHADIAPPSDLSDEQVCASPTNRARAIQNLDHDGWNTDGRYLHASWIRIRYRSNQFREDILDLSLAKLDSDIEHKLLDISRQIRQYWEELPARYRYRDSCWQEAIPTRVCYMILITHLTHFYNEFMIQKLLSPGSPSPCLLRVSLDLLTSVLSLSRAHRDRSYDTQRDCLHAILVFGVPSASVLATGLQEQQRSRQPFPAHVSRAGVIRSLSVLISHLEGASQIDFAGTRRAGGNYGVCRKAARCFARVVDKVLEGEGSGVTPVANQSEPSTAMEDVGGRGTDGFGGADAPVFEGYELQDLGGGLNLDLDVFCGFKGMDFAYEGMGIGNIGNDERDGGISGQWSL